MDWERFYNAFREPDFIPGYEIQNRLGGGAFGDVYKATKTSIGKPYAIKFLKVEDDEQRAVVERELQQVRHFAAIDHPNLVTIEDMGVALGVPYLVMGYAGEDTLARRLRRSRPELSDALAIFVQTCRGVLALHDSRLAHFDLKPSNVFLRGDVARVGDYGLARLLAEGRTTLSFGRGTPQYMAPEMLVSRADHRADIYSLGVILYESVTGELPFPLESGAVLRRDDAPPKFPKDFPAFLQEPVAVALRAAPADRFAGVAELLGALGPAAQGAGSVGREVAAGAGAAPGAAEVARAAWAELRRSEERSARPQHSAAPASRARRAATTRATQDRELSALAGAGVDRGPGLRTGASALPLDPLVRGLARLGRRMLDVGGGLTRLVLFLVFMAALGAGATALVLQLLGEGPFGPAGP